MGNGGACTVIYKSYEILVKKDPQQDGKFTHQQYTLLPI